MEENHLLSHQKVGPLSWKQFKKQGITANGDLKYKLRRGNNNDNLIVLNYWEALSKGISVNDTYVYDGDSIKINKTKSRVKKNL